MPHNNHGPEALSTNAKFLAWVLLGGLMFVGFGFGLWAGTRPPEAKPKEVAKVAPPREETPKPALKKAETPKPVETPAEPKPEPKPVTPEPKPEVVAKKPDPKPEPKPAPKPDVPEVLFAKQLVPVIRSHCLNCHGDPKVNGGLDLRTVEKILKGGDSGDAIKAGDPSKGSLWAQIESGDMPPAGKPRLSDAEKKLFRDWIAGGAK